MNTNYFTRAEVTALPKLYKTEHLEIEDKLILVKLFHPASNWTWYVIEFDGKDLCFGFVKGLVAEFGYFSLTELSQIVGPFGLRVERDTHFTPTMVGDMPHW